MRFVGSTHIPIVLGLGNLHGRLAYNQSFFIYAAALNFYPFFNHGRSIANGFLFLLTFATLLGYLRPVFKQPAIILESHPFKFLPSFFALPYLGYLALTSNGFASPTPDLAGILLQVILFVTLAHGISLWLDEQHNLDHYALLLSILAATSVTIKLSNLVFGIVMLMFVFVYIWQSSQHYTARVLRILGPGMVILLVSCLRGFLLSGAPFYPSTFGYIPVDWAVPRNWIVSEANWIYSWARQPGSDWSVVLGNWDWFIPWISRTFKDFPGIVYPLFLSVLFFCLTIIMVVSKRAKRPAFLEWAILFPVTFALFYWFFTAPESKICQCAVFPAGRMHAAAFSFIH